MNSAEQTQKQTQARDALMRSGPENPALKKAVMKKLGGEPTANAEELAKYRRARFSFVESIVMQAHEMRKQQKKRKALDDYKIEDWAFAIPRLEGHFGGMAVR